MTSVEETQSIAGALGRELGVDEVTTGSWFTKVVQLYLRRNQTRSRPVDESVPRTELAERAIRRASLKTGATGFASGLTSTGAALLTLNTSGVGAVVGVPATAVGLLGDVLYRAVVHVDLTCELAAIYGIAFDPEEPSDLIRLYGLVFQDEEESRPLGGARGMIDRVLSIGGDDVGLKIGRKLVGQALRRNVVPVVGIVTSTVGNVKTTRKLGETVHRYLRYQRALQDEIGGLLHDQDEMTELAIEGVWFMLTADGQMRPEEAAVLGWLLRQRPPVEVSALRRRFVEDEAAWMERLASSPEGAHDLLLRALEVAASVDHSTSLPERRMLRNAARAMGVTFDAGRLEERARELNKIR